MKKSSRSLLIIGLFVFVVSVLMPVNSLAADVDVYVEGAYTESDLAVFIYADINGPNILSAGVKLTYDTSELAVAVAGTEKNESVWFLGSESYMDPDTSTPGEVIIICGKLDTADPTAGVSGERVLLGKVLFDRTESSMPFSPTLSIDYGKGGDYKNFVTTNGTVVDSPDGTGVLFGSITIAERGDANADGSINISDVTEIRKMVFNQIPKTCYADCNNDGNVNISDVTSIRDKVFQ